MFVRVVETLIDRTCFEQPLMSADGGHASCVHDYDSCYEIKECVIDDVRDDKHRTASNKLFENLVNDVFAL